MTNTYSLKPFYQIICLYILYLQSQHQSMNYLMITLQSNNASAISEKFAYNFKFKDLDGSILNLSEYKDKEHLVNSQMQMDFQQLIDLDSLKFL